MNYVTNLNFDNHWYDLSPQSGRLTTPQGDGASPLYSPMLLNSKPTYLIPEPDRRMSWVQPKVLENKMKWTQQKKRMILWKGRKDTKHLHNYPSTSTPDQHCCPFLNKPSLLTWLWLSPVYLHFISMQMIFTFIHSLLNHSFVPIFKFLALS